MSNALNCADDDMGYETYMQDINAWFQAAAEDWSIKLIGGSVIAFCADWFGQDWWLISVLFWLLAADCVLGIISALRFNGCLSGRRLHDGVVKFAAYAVAIILVWLVQEITLHSLPIRLPILAIFAAYQSLTEIKSITRHLERLGLKMPKLLHKVTNGAEQAVEGKLDEVLPDVSDTNVGESEHETK